jgi:hypothetical protein
MASGTAQLQKRFAARYDVRRGHVLLIGEEGCDAAQRIEAERGWPIVQIGDFDEAQCWLRAASSCAALIVSELRPASLRPMLALARQTAIDSPGVSLGYLYGRNSEQLLTAAETMLRPSSTSPSSEQPIRLFNMLASRYPIRAAGLFDAHANAREKSEVIEMFQQPSELDFLVGHSNGCDMGLGGVLLCRHDSIPAAAADELRVMPCYHGGPCSRHAAKKGTVTSSDLAGTRRAIAACCWGVLTGQGPFSPEYSIGESLLLHAGLSSLITTLRVTGFETPELTLLYHYSAAGLPFGAIANLANRLRLAGGFEAEWICFGDPAARIPGAHEPAELNVEAEERAPVRLSVPAFADDVVAFLPEERMPPESIALVRNASEDLSGALSPDGAVFLTTNCERDQEIHLDIIGRCDLKQSTDVGLDLQSGLEFLEVYLQGPLREAHPAEAASAMAAFLALRRVLLGWSLGYAPVGAVMRYEFIAAEFATLDGALVELCSRVLDLAAAYTLRSGCMQSHLWSWAYDQVAYVPDVGRCLQCGSAVSETVLRQKMGAGERRIGFCDGCGFLYDGEAGIDRYLVAPESIAAGGTCKLGIVSINTSRFRNPASILCVFDRYETAASVLVREDFSVLPGEERQCCFEIEIPRDAAKGVHYLGATVMVGTKLACYQRPIWVNS